MMATIYAKDPTGSASRAQSIDPKFYRLRLTAKELRRYNNGMMVSIGIIVGEGAFRVGSLRRLLKAERAVEITAAEWNHSGCRSSCTLRGKAECRW